MSSFWLLSVHIQLFYYNSTISLYVDDEAVCVCTKIAKKIFFLFLLLLTSLSRSIELYMYKTRKTCISKFTFTQIFALAILFLFSRYCFFVVVVGQNSASLFHCWSFMCLKKVSPQRRRGELTTLLSTIALQSTLHQKAFFQDFFACCVFLYFIILIEWTNTWTS